MGCFCGQEFKRVLDVVSSIYHVALHYLNVQYAVARLLAYVSGLANEQLLLRNECLIAENRFYARIYRPDSLLTRIRRYLWIGRNLRSYLQTICHHGFASVSARFPQEGSEAPAISAWRRILLVDLARRNSELDRKSA